MSRRIDTAEFVTSAVTVDGFPADGRPEVALVGRSNVGKSSLINALLRKPVARTSASPGKTRQVNVYRVTPAGSSPFYLVDLPGYGHTAGGGKARDEFRALTSLYFESRTGGLRESDAGSAPRPLRAVILAIDSRHPGMASDVDALRWVQALAVPTVLVATKADKLSQSDHAKLTRACRAAFGADPLAVSAEDGSGLDELWKRLREWMG